MHARAGRRSQTEACTLKLAGTHRLKGAGVGSMSLGQIQGALC